MKPNVSNRLDWPTYSVGFAESFGFFPRLANLERREISRSTALRIRSARFSLASKTTSMRLSMPSGRRTSIGFTFIGGRPMRGSVADTGYVIKSSQKAISLIDTIPDIAYGFNYETEANMAIDDFHEDKLVKAAHLAGIQQAKAAWGRALVRINIVTEANTAIVVFHEFMLVLAAHLAVIHQAKAAWVRALFRII